MLKFVQHEKPHDIIVCRCFENDNYLFYKLNFNKTHFSVQGETLKMPVKFKEKLKLIICTSQWIC